MMTLKLLVMLLLAYVHYIEASPHRFVEPFDNNPSFDRHSVELIPSDDTKKMSLRLPNYADIEGIDEVQFSRAAVESSPKTIVSDYRPLRLAVEYNPKEEAFSRLKSRQERFLDVVIPNRPRQSKGYDLQAYIIPVYNPYDNDPLYYRAGSPYQELIDASQYEQLQNKQSLPGNTRLRLKEEPENSKYKVVCHITNWSFYRKDSGRFTPENLDYSLCTHIIYAFASLDPEELIIREFDPWVDIENNLYARVVSLAEGKPVYLAIGGWTDSTNGKYSNLVSDKKRRENFIDNAVPFLKRFGFAGLHIDWNYPTCPQSDCKIGNKSDKEHLTEFIKELRYRLKQSNLKVSLSASGYREILVRGYDFEALSDYVEFILLMSYDYHGSWENVTGHVSPLYGGANDLYPQYNVNHTVQLLIEKGAKREKIIMGIPFYGQSFRLKSSKKQGFNAPALGPGEPGELTNQPGMLGYNEICNLLRRANFKKGTDPTGNSGPYLTDGRTWAGYDDYESILKKTEYIIKNKLGGASAWTADLDDFNNNCCSEAFPLLKAINRGLGRIKSKKPTEHNCQKPTVVVPPTIEMSVTEDTGYAGIPMSTTESSYQWTQSTTKRPGIQSTTNKPYQGSTEKPPKPSTAIPSPVNPMPVYVPNETCNNGDYKKYPGSCNKYLICVGQMYLEQPCPTGLHWNNEHKHCDWPEYANCKETIQKDEEVTTERSTTEESTTSTTMRQTETTSRRTSRPTKVTRSTTTASPSTSRATRSTTRTTESTIKVTRPTTSESTTRATRPTRRTTRRTTTLADYTTTVFTTTTLPETTTTVQVTPSSTKKPMKKPMKCDNGSYYPHKDCSKYYICNNHRKVTQSCPEGLQYSQKFNICDFEENVKCVSRKKYMKLLERHYQKTGIFTASLLRAQSGDPCKGQQFLSYPGVCSKYFICDHKQLLEQSCSAGLVWNTNINNCDWPANFKCVDDPSVSGDEEYDEDNELETEDESNEEIDEDENEFKPTSSVKPPSVTSSVKPPPASSTGKPSKNPPKPVKDPIVTSLQTIPVKENVEPLTGKYKLVCYFTNWAWYRPGDGKYLPDDIDPNLCTHIVYGFAVLNYDELTIRTHDSWADIDNRFYERVVALKSKGIKVTLAIGGWNDSLGDKYSRLVRSAIARAKFIRHAVEFLEKYGFDGLDLDWEYPVCWQVDCKKGYSDEKQHFATFVRELSEVFVPKGLLLSAAVSPSKTVIDAGYDVPELAKYFDWIAVMCYDYHGQWDKKTGHVAPLYYHPDDEVDFFNTDYTIKYWLKLGAPKDKIVMGMPLYGQSFTLSDPKNNGLNAKAPGPGEAGELTRAAGFLSYREICDRIFNRGWTVVQDSEGRLGPYAYKGNQWVSFDDQAMLRKKTQYIKELGIAGGMIWALDLDDFRGSCGQGKHPLLKIIHAELQDETGNEVEGDEEDEYPEEEDNNQEAEVEKPVEKPEQKPEVNEVDDLEPEIENEEETEVAEEGEGEDYDEEFDEDEVEIDEYEGQYKVVCYFTNWAWYRPGIGKFKPEDIDPELCTHIVYGFAVLNRDTLTIQPHDSWADIDNNFYSRVVEFKKKGIKVTVAIGGWNDSAGDKYSRLVRNAAARARFITHVIEFIEKYDFDGLDLDWEYPVCWQVECNKGNPDEKDAFATFVEELATAFKPKGLLLSSAVSPAKKVIDAGYDVKKISKNFDWISVMAYDYHGQWDKKTGHVSPMYVHPEAWEKTFNTNFTINYWLSKGADPRKLILGMPMYGQSFSLAERSNNGLNSPTYGGGEAGEETRARGFLSYYEICDRIKNKKWTVVKDLRGTIGPYAYSGDQWVSFDDSHMIRHKSEYVKALGLGGAMIWALDLDDFTNSCGCEEYPLLRTINRVLRKYPGPHNDCQLESRKTPPKPTAEETTKKPITSTTAVSVTYRPSKKTTTSRTTSTTFEGEDYDEEYPDSDDEEECMEGAYYPHESDCGMYYICNHQQKVVQKCMFGLQWNQNVKNCDWPQNVRCVSKDEEQEIDNDVDDGETEVSSSAAPKPSKKPVSTTSKPVTSKPVTSKPASYKPSTTHKPKPPKPSKTPVQSDPFVPTGNNEYMVVCYFTNWAWYRPGIGKYKPDDIDTTLCTHIVYGFAVLNGQTLTIRTHDSWADIDNNFYTRVSGLKEKGVKVSIAIGGWNDSLGDKYSRLVLDPEARKRFIDSVLVFMRKYGFEGLDLDWEYPVCWQVDCQKGKPAEKDGFTALVRELHEAFEPEGFLLSAAVSPAKKVIDAGYDIPELSKYFDWIAVMCYDYHGQWDKKTGHVAPLYVHEDDWEPTFNAEFTIRYWIDGGAPPEKLVLGMPTYGQSFTLEKVANNGLNAISTGPGLAGEYTRSAGFLAFYEICYKISQGGWTVVKDPNGIMGPYAYNDRQWFSYDDVEQIRLKTKFVKELKLGGAMIWALDLDDFRNRCGCGTHPLLSTINLELGRISTSRLSDCT